jgi:hypothetical protein
MNKMTSQLRIESTKQHLAFDETRYLQISSIVSQLKKEDIPPPHERPVFVAWGALRLFLMVLNFFNRYVKLPRQIFQTLDGPIMIEKTICVYAGAAPGISIFTLNKLYPWIHYELYDPVGNDPRLGFTAQLRNLPNVNLHSREFDDFEAKLWKDYIKNNPTHMVYFISDIRTVEYPEKPNRQEFEDEQEFIKRLDEVMLKRDNIIASEMEMQKKWTETILPHGALLKFRPPTQQGSKVFKYLDGFVYRGVYGDIDSLENFLVPSDNITTREWNIQEYEGAMNFHNYIFRSFPFINVINGSRDFIAPALGLTNNYDSTVFTIFIRDYFECFRRNEEKPSSILKLIDKITKILGRRDDDNNPLRIRLLKIMKTTSKK